MLLMKKAKSVNVEVTKYFRKARIGWMESGAFTKTGAPEVSQKAQSFSWSAATCSPPTSTQLSKGAAVTGLQTRAWFCTQLWQSLFPAQQTWLSFTGVAALRIRPKYSCLQKESESSDTKSAQDWLICHSMRSARDADVAVVWRLLVIALIS